MSFWICADEYPTETHLYYFTHTFSAAPGATLTARSCGDTRYRLLLNGHPVCEGPCQGSSYVRYYEESDLTPFLDSSRREYADGRGAVCARGIVYLCCYRGSRPAFWLDGCLTAPDGDRRPLGTDGSWRCTREDAVGFYHVPGVHTSVPP